MRIGDFHVIERLNDRKSRGSLRHQVQAAARELAGHKQAVRLRRAALAERLRAGLTSPSMLLFAASTGFVFAEFTGRGGSAQDWKSPRESRHPSMAGLSQALGFALEMYGFAHAATRAIGAEPHHPRSQAPLSSE